MNGVTPYLLLFTVTTVLVGAAASPNNHSRLVRWLFSALAITFTSVFAGARDFDVGGPDVSIYGNKVFSAMAATPNVTDIMTYANERGVDGEVGYYFLNWAVSRFTVDAHVFYGVLAALCSGSILVAIMLMRRWGPATVMWVTYMLTAYPEGFNLLRQSPALALAVLGVAVTLRARKWLGLAIGASGLLFHNSAIVFLVMWAVTVYLSTRRERIGRAVWIVMVLSVLSLAAVAPVLDILTNSLSDSKYQEYLGEGARGGRAFGVDALYRTIPLAAGVWVLAVTRSFAAPSKAPTNPLRVPVGALKRHPVDPGLLLRTANRTESIHTVEVTARRALITVLVLLSLELVLLPVREISYPFYRLLAYFGYLRILGYGLIVGVLPRGRVFGGLLAVAFAAAYFWLIIIDRNEAFYSSAVFDEWFKAQ